MNGPIEFTSACNTLGANWVNPDTTTPLNFSTGYISQAKIALKGVSEEQLLELEAIAKSLNLCARSIEDQ
jgi:hypothetical protein